MATRFGTIGRFAWNAWAGVSLVALVALVGVGARAFWANRGPKVDESGPDDVRFVLNWANLSSAHIDVVEHSYLSPRSLTGDHLDAYAMRVVGVSEETFHAVDEVNGARWALGPTSDATLRGAIELVAGCASGAHL
jgi:hypothetical protein